MPISLSQRVDAQCPKCGTTFSIEFWLIIDAGERPDLAARCRDGSIFMATCPNGHTSSLSAPLLYHDRAREQLILVVPPGTDEQTMRAIHAQLMPRLQAHLLAPFPAYLERTQVVPQQLLPAALSDDPDAALAAEMARTMPPLMRALQEFINADSWDQAEQILQAHPELLSDEADQLLAQLIDAARAQGDADAEKMFTEYREYLRRQRSAVSDQPSANSGQRSAVSGQPSAVSIPAELRALLEEIARLTRLSEIPRKVELCERALQRVRRKDNPPLWAALQVTLANALAQNPLGNRTDNLERAIEHYALALQVYTREAFPVEHRQTARNLGNAFVAKEDWFAARSTYAQAIQTAEQLFRYAVDPTTQRAEAAELADLYDRDINACVSVIASRAAVKQSPNYESEIASSQPFDSASLRSGALLAMIRTARDALTAAEAARSRAFLKQLGLGDYAAPPNIPTALLQRERDLITRLRDIEAELASTPTRADRATERERELVAQRRALQSEMDAVWDAMLQQGGDTARAYIALRRGETPTWDDLRALAERLGKDTALVEFHTLDDKIVAMIWRAHMDAPQLITLPIDRNRLLYRYLLPYEQEVLNYLSHVLLGREIHNDWLALGEELLAPLEPALGDASLVYFIPHGYLHLVPLHALTVRGKPFIAERAVAYAPSAAVLARALTTADERPPTAAEGQPSAVSGQALVMGYTPKEEERPTFIGEAVEIAKMFGVQPVVDDAATRAALTHYAPRSKLIHLSCHGIFNANDPLASAVRLADGVFTAREWMHLQLDADLVTLSACQLAFSDVNPGDDLVGMTRALFYAGAVSVLLALWSVPADTTMAWMRDFYARLQRGQVKAFAHRDATLALMRAYPDEPYIWAPFVLVGSM